MKTLIVIALLALAAYGINQYALPAWAEVQSIRTQRSQIAEVRKQVDEIKEVRDEVIRRFNNVDKTKLERIDEMLPPKGSEEDTYVFLENLVKVSGLSLAGIMLSDQAQTANLVPGARQAITFEMKSKGSYEGFRSLLDVIEKNLRIMDIQSIGVEENERHFFETDIKGRMYYGD